MPKISRNGRFEHGFSEEVFYRLYFAVHGSFRIIYPGGVCVIEPGNFYKPVSAELTYTTGKLTVALNNGKKLTLVMALKQNILYLDDPGGAIAGMKPVPASDFPKVRAFNAERGVAPYQLLSDG